MKRKFNYCLLLITVLFFSANVSQAAFVVKKEAKKVTEQTPVRADNNISNPAITADNLNTLTTNQNITHKKQHFFNRLVSKISKGSAGVSQAAYIILSVFFLGWLAIGINENWEGLNWLIGLLLYLLVWVGGFVFAMIMMGKYY